MTGEALSYRRIYVENTRARDRAYDVTEEMVRNELSRQSLDAPESVTVAFSDERDQQAWGEADVLVAGRLDVTAIAQMQELKLIQCTSAGVENYLPFDWLAPHVMLCNASGAHAAKIREFGSMAVLMLHEHVPARVSAQSRREWARSLRPTSRGKRVLVYGAGSLGSAVADGLSGYGFELVAIGRDSSRARPGFAESYGPEALDRELARADILVLAAPLTPETRGRFGARELALLPRGAALLNIGRAGLLDHAALSRNLRDGHLSGAILDVFKIEPLPSENDLWTVPNLMVFPHVSADDPSDYARACVEIMARNLAAAARGQSLINRVDPTLGY